MNTDEAAADYSRRLRRYWNEAVRAKYTRVICCCGVAQWSERADDTSATDTVLSDSLGVVLTGLAALSVEQSASAANASGEPLGPLIQALC